MAKHVDFRFDEIADELEFSHNVIVQGETCGRIAREKRGLYDLGSIIFFGFGLYWTWLWVFEETPVLSCFAGGRKTDGFDVIIHAACIAMLLAGAWGVRWFSGRRGQGVLVAAAGIGAVVATGISVVQPIPPILDVVGAVLTGISRACFNLLWAAFYCRIGLKRGAVFMFGSVAVGAFVCITTTGLHPGPAVFVELCLPILATAAYIFSERHLSYLDGNDVPYGLKEWAPRGIGSFPLGKFVRLFGGIFIYGAAFMFLNRVFFAADYAGSVAVYEFAFLGVFLVGSVIAVVAYQFSHYFNLLVAYKCILPIVVAGFLLTSLLHGSNRTIAVGVVFVGFTIFDVITWLALAYSSRRLLLSPLVTFGFGRTAHFLGLIVGSFMAGVAVLPSGDLSDWFPVLAFFFVVALIVASTLILTEKFLFYGEPPTNVALSESIEVAVAPNAGSTDAEAMDSERVLWNRRCAAIAADYGLTPREQEVFLLLAKGRDGAFIQNALGISDHTVRSHIYHIYQKVGAHSRQDLLDLVEYDEIRG